MGHKVILIPHNTILEELSQLMDNKLVGLYSSVFCRDTNNEVKKRKLLRYGIACDCCGFVFSLARFEAHVGCTKHRPSATIFLEDGRSLLNCQRKAMKEEGPEIMNDSIRSVCHYSDELMLCDCCPSSFHPYCLGFDHVPGVCDQDCEKVFLRLQKLIRKPFCVSGDDLIWTLMKAVQSDELERLSQNERKLSVALGVLRECFDPFLDAFFGRDIVIDVIFSRGSELNCLNFRGFYNVVLEKNGEVIYVATI
ncbi:hypothetical protein VNO77_04289 [Canavalia gladiata]|uniref:Zinc finger PHD-type domain-containing protein n=1 Tax=Canavalia gladiata TaxID=3824 RepID=A0AAN9MW94_CANGL